jgi:CheY-like chemotaxis protein
LVKPNAREIEDIARAIKQELAAAENLLPLFASLGLSDEASGMLELLTQRITAAQNLARTLTTSDGATPRKPRVLVVDDDELQLVFLKRSLEKEGLDVTSTNSGSMAVTQLSQQPFELVILDCQMPLMDGFEVAKRIRSIDSVRGKRTPLLAYTGHAIAGYKQLCLQSGMDEYLKKPALSKEIAEIAHALIAVNK